jgi:BirA family biotin operon repressor/biotin-[acetyl-CoA-carboxylase] ligase
MEEMSFLTEYKARCFILGRSITIHPSYDDKGITAEALDIDDDGGLVVRYTEGPNKGSTETLHTGEISVSVN